MRIALATILLASAAVPAQAVLLARYATLDGAVVAGAAVDAYVDFDINYATNILTISLHNLAMTATNGDLLDGIAFNVSGAAVNTTLQSTVATTLYTTKAGAPQSNVPINGAYQLGTPFGGFANGPGPLTVNAVNYGYALGAAAWSGIGAFAANNFGAGGGGDDYAILGAQTNLATTNVNQNQFPMVKDGVTFTLQNFAITPGQTITGVAFLFGSAPAGTASGINETPPPPVNTPEPGSMALLVGALGMLAGARRRA